MVWTLPQEKSEGMEQSQSQSQVQLQEEEEEISIAEYLHTVILPKLQYVNVTELFGQTQVEQVNARTSTRVIPSGWNKLELSLKRVAGNGEKTFVTGFTPWYAHTCPLLKSLYQCYPWNNFHFNAYTISSLTYPLHNNSRYAQMFFTDTTNLYHKHYEDGLRREHTLLRTRKDVSVFEWTNSFGEQPLISLLCTLFEFDLTRFTNAHVHPAQIELRLLDKRLQLLTALDAFDQFPHVFKPCVNDDWNGVQEKLREKTNATVSVAEFFHMFPYYQHALRTFRFNISDPLVVAELKHYTCSADWTYLRFAKNNLKWQFCWNAWENDKRIYKGLELYR
ncbi:hypothetical protein RFI_34623 [Reticulomyxa filosa]|uniref:Uncharacterized protein n=1 Tax=Reticulomyxa filosa TaxID=46433 RepID=X6LNS2_RETFI|nr:hypothetical protein RFI_34623 [Reticulomyxa filosa]|eukprot:ETO02792.1 hypothetical protein RFI_34623 [Reticulomyxa filosa]